MVLKNKNNLRKIGRFVLIDEFVLKNHVGFGQFPAVLSSKQKKTVIVSNYKERNYLGLLYDVGLLLYVGLLFELGLLLPRLLPPRRPSVGKEKHIKKIPSQFILKVKKLFKT